MGKKRLNVHVDYALVEDGDDAHAEDPEVEEEKDNVFPLGVAETLEGPSESGEALGGEVLVPFCGGYDKSLGVLRLYLCAGFLGGDLVRNSLLLLSC